MGVKPLRLDKFAMAATHCRDNNHSGKDPLPRGTVL